MVEDFPELDVDYFTTYEGVVESGEKEIHRKEGGQTIGEKLKPAANIAAGAGEAFEWGYGGRGPLTTAMTVLEDAYDPKTAREYGQEFMESFVAAELDSSEGWTLEAQEIPEYLEV
ncbi:MAG: DUF6166 domain-containing protein [Candidatus Nanohalobium sp.]